MLYLCEKAKSLNKYRIKKINYYTTKLLTCKTFLLEIFQGYEKQSKIPKLQHINF